MVKLFCISGVQRGGQHFIMNYILAMFSTALFKNDCKFSLDEGHYTYKYYKHGKLSTNTGSNSYDKIKDSHPHEVIILGAENICIKEESDIYDNTNISKNIVESKATKYNITDISFIQIIRNPLNVLSSCIKMGKGKNNGFNRNDYVNMILDTLKNIIHDMEKNESNIYYVNYDKFLTNIKIRKDLIVRCGGTEIFNNIEKSMNNVRLSSFGRNSTTNYLNRFVEMKQDERYQQLTNDELVGLAKKHFATK